MILPVSNIGITGYINKNIHSRKNSGNEIRYANTSDIFIKNSQNISFGKLTDIPRFARVDENLYRGGRPNLEQLFDLKEEGVKRIIDFSVEPNRISGFDEKTAAENIGLRYFKIPFVSWENPSDEAIEKFFEIAQDCKNKNEKFFIHCVEGRDRTGLFTELYKIRYGLSNAQQSIETLIKKRYNFSENALAIPFIKEFAQKVSAKI